MPVKAGKYQQMPLAWTLRINAGILPILHITIMTGHGHFPVHSRVQDYGNTV